MGSKFVAMPRGGGGRKKILIPAYNFFFRVYPRRRGGVQKKFA